jgi:hypothetical protein
LSDGSMRHRLLRRLLVIATKTWVGVMVSSSLMHRKHLRALRDVDRGRQARHEWDLEAAHRLVFVFQVSDSDVPGHLTFFTG